jgi:hypothetical protein
MKNALIKLIIGLIIVGLLLLLINSDVTRQIFGAILCLCCGAVSWLVFLVGLTNIVPNGHAGGSSRSDSDDRPGSHF